MIAVIMIPQILAVVGMAGSGKSLACQILSERLGYRPVYFGGVVVNEVVARGLPVTPEHERAVREELRAEEGMEAVARRSLPDIHRITSISGRVVLDGLYSGAELSFLQGELAQGVTTLAVHAPLRLRQQRLAGRSVRPLSPSELRVRDEFEVRHLDKAGPIALADLHVVNDHEVLAFAVNLEATLRWVATFGQEP